ncbi:MAG: hypothetical protein HKM87_01050 [Ignavibacteriaceae bacterium]|nr:hypothetical protein [Ignavibacteriaceae bacterium]
MKNIFLFSITFVLLTHTTSFTQAQEHSSEVNSTVPELSEFHEVIYPIWHTAYPEKDIAMLKEMLSEVNKGAEKIYSAELPGILRDKKEEWDEGVNKFRASVDRYNVAAEGNEEDLLSSAEELHSNFEMLVRIIRPVTKEVDEFHKVLYMIYHHYWPNKDQEEFSQAVDDLQLRAEELNNCVLPNWIAEKADIIKEQSQKLFNSTNTLKELKDNSANDSEINNAIESVHIDYMALEALFDD